MPETTKISLMSEMRNPLKSLCVPGTRCLHECIDHGTFRISISHGEDGVNTTGSDGAEETIYLIFGAGGFSLHGMIRHESRRVIKGNADFFFKLRTSQQG